MVSPELDGGLNMFSTGKLMKGGIVQQSMFDDTGGYRHRYHGCVLLFVEPPFGLRLLLPFWCRRGGYWCTAGVRKRKIGARVGLEREK